MDPSESFIINWDPEELVGVTSIVSSLVSRLGRFSGISGMVMLLISSMPTSSGAWGVREERWGNSRGWMIGETWEEETGLLIGQGGGEVMTERLRSTGFIFMKSICGRGEELGVKVELAEGEGVCLRLKGGSVIGGRSLLSNIMLREEGGSGTICWRMELIWASDTGQARGRRVVFIMVFILDCMAGGRGFVKTMVSELGWG